MPDEPMPPLPEIRNRANLLKWRNEYHAWKERLNSAATKARRDEELALCKPPSKAWRIGSWIAWEPPDTADRKQVTGYWISQEFEPGKWSHEGDYRQPHVRCAKLMGAFPAVRVESYYKNMVGGNGPRFYSEILRPGPEPEWLVHRVEYYASERRYGRAHVERWLRVLAAFGYRTPTAVRGSIIDTAGHEPITMAEALDCLGRYSWRRWQPVVEVLERLELAK
ncbi:MAG: hypothetical protein OXB91_07455 [Bryobacterales bacterium]|nr:hypothetical protein [Bryobacterales bacterium]